MQSHLTRRVFWAILNNEPLHSSRCHNRLLHTTAPAHRARILGVSNSQHVQRRGFFAFNVSQPSGEKSSTLPSETGLKPMRDLMKAMAHKNRGPPNDILARAFREFFVARAEAPGFITGFQARMLILTWKHLKAQQDELEPEEWQAVYSTENLENVLFVLSEATCLPESRDAILKIARFAFLELRADHGFGTNTISRPAIISYINLQALNGNPEEARHIVHKFWSRLRKTKPSPFLAVMKGFAMNGDKRQLKRVTEDLEKHGRKFDCRSHEELTIMLIDHDLLDAAKTIYEFPISDSQEPSLAAKMAVARYAIFKSELSWVKPIVESLSQHPSPDIMNIILLWEAANGKDATGISEKVKSWMAENRTTESPLTISCVNDLIGFANSIKDPRLAAEFSALVPQWGLEANNQTLILQLGSLVQAGDVDGTLEFLQGLPELDLMATDNIPLMNQLVAMLCMSKQDDALFDQVSLLLDPFFESNVRLEASTIAALTHMLLYRHDWEAVSELLRPRLGSYDTEERTKIRDALTGFILDPNQTDTDVWEVYGLLRIAFPETGVSMRTDIMNSFFDRGKNDLACLVFGHMRQAEDFQQRPKPDTYARCFQGISRTGDAKNLELIHNMLKLDAEVNLNTRVLNGLMLAYAACEMAEMSMEVFRDILQTEEGPSHKTIAIFFKVCEKHHNGAQEAMKMMKKVKILEIDVDRRLYMSYVEALAAQCEFNMAAEAIDNMQAETGYTPTRNTIGLFYNTIPYQYWKDEVEKWAKVKYAEQWTQLEELERSEHEEGQKFNGIVNEVFV
ncbi:hypothetical protein MW887_008437 [Aspergillus wentii]|nr:hypothetical protein MW887_008437 [Aspergillus wentii]